MLCYTRPYNYKKLFKGSDRAKFDVLNRSLLIQSLERNLTQEARKYSRDIGIVFKREYSFHPVKRSARGEWLKRGEASTPSRVSLKTDSLHSVQIVSLSSLLFLPFFLSLFLFLLYSLFFKRVPSALQTSRGILADARVLLNFFFICCVARIYAAEIPGQ